MDSGALEEMMQGYWEGRGSYLHHVTVQHLGWVAAPSVKDVVIVPDHEARDARKGITVVLPPEMLAIMAEIKLLDLGLHAAERRRRQMPEDNDIHNLKCSAISASPGHSHIFLRLPSTISPIEANSKFKHKPVR